MVSKLHRKASLAILLINMLLISCGCTDTKLAYQAPIQQGNLLNSTTISQLHKGMQQEEVRKLLGTPIIADPYNSSRWTYVYRLKENGRLSKAHYLVAHFTNDKRLSRIDTDVQQATTPHPS